jgi:hypothetical protein
LNGYGRGKRSNGDIFTGLEYRAFSVWKKSVVKHIPERHWMPWRRHRGQLPYLGIINITDENMICRRLMGSHPILNYCPFSAT